MNEVPTNFLCCDLSEEANEPLFGTAVTAPVWFMLEYTRPWPAKATSDNELSTEVQSWLDEQIAETNGRLQFIRQFRPDGETKTFMVGVASRLYAFQVHDYDALLDLDMEAMLAGDASVAQHLVNEKHYFVCTNGKRDRSCALRGAALYRAFAAQMGANVWMTTHLGGHRFAPTLLSLPDGYCYGRIHPQDVAQFVKASAQNEVWLDKVRGQTKYSKIEQVADYFLRQERAFLAEQGLVLLRGVEENGRWIIQFQDEDEHLFSVTIIHADPISIFPNSNNPATKEILQYQLLAISNM